jgi:hypothetical protein
MLVVVAVVLLAPVLVPLDRGSMLALVVLVLHLLFLALSLLMRVVAVVELMIIQGLPLTNSLD